MHVIVMLLILVSTTFDFLVVKNLLPSPAKYVVELIGAFVFIYVVAAGVRDRFRYVRPAYWILFGAIALDMVCGVLANNVEAGPLFAGIRNFLRAIPLFFLAATFNFTERQIKTQLALLLAIALLQLPLAVHQRMTTIAGGGITGDTTYGTLMLSSTLSIFLICAVSVLMGLYLRKLISAKLLAVLFLLLVIPTTINETKGTLLLLPVALGTVFLLGAKPGTRFKNVFLAGALLAMFAAVFVPIYDALIVKRPYPVKIGDFFTDPSHLENYLSKRDAEVGTTEQVGRVDSIVVPLRLLSRDPAQLVFGVGLGNASHSSLGHQFTGKYNYLWEPFLLTTVSVVESELGLLGLFLLVAVYWLIYSDCRALARSDSPLMGALALGWAGATAVMALSLPYKNLIPSAAMSFLFWYFSGLIAAARMRLDYEAARRPPAGPPSGDRDAGRGRSSHPGGMKPMERSQRSRSARKGAARTN